MTYYGQTFKVIIGETVKVYKKQEVDGENANPNRYVSDVGDVAYVGDVGYSTKPCFQCEATKVFIGKSPLNRMTEFSGGYGSRFKGNSILIENVIEDVKTYVFVGQQIVWFRPIAQIVQFMSPVGNNNVSYPWARDELGNTYLMIENVILSPTCEWDDHDPYEYYYDHNLMTPHFGRKHVDGSCVQPLYPLVNSIECLKVGIEKYAMIYHPFAKSDYNRMLDWKEGNISVLLTDGTERPLPLEEYVQMMKDCGKQRGFVPLITYTIL